jgi:hypothetical protein
VAFAIVWSLVFGAHHEFDGDRFIESHLALILDAIRLRDENEATG